ncbi:hypothetical protein BaRGS_00007083 [Batillaria attramentaria]|uniref:Uncharacterized protein n=1 Tax=Batillaria attramentaria TaxID=370345 RepID=A0ABD0LQN7_9CAEN
MGLIRLPDLPVIIVKEHSDTTQVTVLKLFVSTVQLFRLEATRCTNTDYIHVRADAVSKNVHVYGYIHTTNWQVAAGYLDHLASTSLVMPTGEVHRSLRTTSAEVSHCS